jgi:hypothetical protein
VETQSSEVSGVVTGKEMTQMVLNGRNFSQLVMLTPGVVSQTNQQEGTVGICGRIDYAVNGGRAVYNNWEIDGGDNMDNGSNGTINVYPNVDANMHHRQLATWKCLASAETCDAAALHRLEKSTRKRMACMRSIGVAFQMLQCKPLSIRRSCVGASIRSTVVRLAVE